MVNEIDPGESQRCTTGAWTTDESHRTQPEGRAHYRRRMVEASS
jgi:hypothetical protein